jgi:hypothetical protein
LSGITKAFFVGEIGTSDQISEKPVSILMAIYRGDGNRIWYEPHYFDKSLSPIGKITTTIPRSPEDKNQLIDALIAFAPAFFQSSRHLTEIKKILERKTILDFDLDDEIPSIWESLRNDCKVILENDFSYKGHKIQFFETNYHKKSF